MDFSRFFNLLLSWLFVFPMGFLCLAPMRNSLRVHSRRVYPLMLILISSLLVAGAFFVVRFEAIPNAVLLPILFLLFLAYKKAVAANLAQACAVFLFFGCVMSVATNLAYAIDAAYNPDLGAGRESLRFGFFRSLFSLIVLILFYRLFRKYYSFLVEQMQNPIVWWIRGLISAILLLVNFSMAPQQYRTLFVNNIFRVFLSLQAVIFTLEILISVIFYHILKNLIHLSELRVRNNLMEMQEKAYEKQQRYMEENARIRHDFKHTIRTIKVMAENGELEELNGYLNEYVKTIPENEIRNYCANTSLNALLNHYGAMAEKRGIETELRIELPPPEKMPLSNTELCSVVGNVLENAINAGTAQEEGEIYIRLSLRVEKNNAFYIVAVNSFNGNPIKRNGRYLSTGKKRSGIGLRSITSTVEQHGGVAYFHHKGKEFFTDIMVPLAPPSGALPSGGDA